MSAFPLTTGRVRTPDLRALIERNAGEWCWLGRWDYLRTSYFRDVLGVGIQLRRQADPRGGWSIFARSW